MLNPSLTQTGSSLTDRPKALLDRFAHADINGCLIVTARSIEWRLYFHQGQLTYGTHSIEPFERLERYLRSLSSQNPKLNSAVRESVRDLFTNSPVKNSAQTADYQAILWLIQHNYLNGQETQVLVSHLMREILQSYLLLETFSHHTFIPYPPFPFVHLNYGTIITECQKKLAGWRKLSSHIHSSYQRPCVSEQETINQSLPPAQREKLKKILIGFNFRQLAVLLNQNALSLAQNLYPLIVRGAIDLQAPPAPFDRLPTFSPPASTVSGSFPDPRDSLATRPRAQTNIVCVDDSPAMLGAIKRFLSGQNVEIHTITDPLKALREIVRLEPKLILLDVGMPNLDGYRLCRLIRNHSLFKETPVIMVTGNTGMIDRAKAKVSGATDYLTKPFSQNELEKIVIKYLVP